jgi:tRNA(fMet)-specific endonuclease VapC
MKRYLLDTKPAQDFNYEVNGIRERVNTERLRGNRIGICTPVLGELWAGATGSMNRERSLKRLLNGISRLIVWPYDSFAAEMYGRLFTQLKQAGRPMQQIDIQIAAIAFTLGNCTVISEDSDFAAIPGLSIERWSPGRP